MSPLGVAAVWRSLLLCVAAAAVDEGKTERRDNCLPCGTGRHCVPATSLCDGSWDCPAGEDEARQLCEAHLLQKGQRFSDEEWSSGRINSRTPRPALAQQISSSPLDRNIRQVDGTPSPLGSADPPRSPIIVRTVQSLNSSNTSNLIFIHLPDGDGNHPTLVPSLTRDNSIIPNATFVNRLSVKTRNSESRAKYKHSNAVKDCCGHCVLCASSRTCVAHTQLCDGRADCELMEDEAPAFCQVFLRGGCPSGLGPCNGLCVPWAVACSDLCVQRPHFEACFAVRRKQLDISFVNKSTTDPTHLRIPLTPLASPSHAALRPALPAGPLPQTVDSTFLTRPADSPFPNISTDELKKPHLPELNDKFIKVPGSNLNTQTENTTSSEDDMSLSIIYKCAPISQKEKISSLLSANKLLLNSPTKSSFYDISPEDLMQTPSQLSNKSSLSRLKAALASIHRNLLSLNKSSNETRSSKFIPSNYPAITYHCVLATNASDTDLNSGDFMKSSSNSQNPERDDSASDLFSLNRNNGTNGANASSLIVENNLSLLLNSDSNAQTPPVRDGAFEVLQPSPEIPATTHRPPLSDLMKVLTSPPPPQMMPSCPPIFTPVAHTCLAALPFPMTWQDAGDVCEKLGGQLAETRDISLLTAVAKFLRLGGSRANFWIGGYYDAAASAWMWRSGAKMTMSTPFWGYRHTNECSELEGRSYNPRSNPACTHHKQAPLNSTKGFCAALDSKFFYFITDHSCMQARKVLCSHDRTW